MRQHEPRPGVLDLESRRLLAADLTCIPNPLPGFYGPGDAVEMSVSVSNSGDVAVPALVVTVNMYLTLDTVVGNADDVLVGIGGNATAIPPGGTRSVQAPFVILPTTPAGDYFVACVLDDPSRVAETNENNNTGITPTAVIRVATEQLTSSTITGTAGNDKITIEGHGVNTTVTVNGVTRYFQDGAFADLFIDTGAGNDRVFPTNAGVDIPLRITGGGGNDTLVGGNGDDEVSGANGRDRVFGGAGNDLVIGGANPDTVGGELGNDLILGAGGNDRLSDVIGKDWFIGGNGDDVIISLDLENVGIHDPDTVSGNAGNDRAQLDYLGAIPDLYSSIEQLL
jgi:Ca2+-binding RTX toxin-like protein